MEHSLKEVPSSVLESLQKYFWYYTVGFVRAATRRSPEAALLGSGVLVSVKNVKAILTVGHVIDILPRSGRLGLVLSEQVEQTTLDVDGLSYEKIARGEDAKAGPDLGAVILSPTLAATLAARKSFYNLTIRRDRLLNEPLSVREGIWATNGFVQELTLTEASEVDSEQVKAFCQFGAFGGIDDYRVEGEYDYYSFPLVYGQNTFIPDDFGGTSGGGLWYVPMIQNDNGDFQSQERLLRGLAFYQQPPTENHSALTCHGTKSIYNVAYAAISRYAS